MYLFIVHYTDGTTNEYKLFDRESAEKFMELFEVGDFDNVAWFGYKPYKPY